MPSPEPAHAPDNEGCGPRRGRYAAQRFNRMNNRPSNRIALLPEAAGLAVAAGLIYLQFHWFGNTTEVGNFGRSAFGWMVSLWKSARIFGGATNWLGWVIPAISVALVLLRSRQLAREPKAVWWPGLALVALAVLAHWAGARAQQTRLSLLALILLLWAIPLFLYGWRFARHLAFPAALLVFCVPLNFLDAATFPMRIMATGTAVLILNGFGLRVGRAGSMLVGEGDTAYGFDGSDPASGLGIVLMIAALACLAAYLVRMSMVKRALFLLLVVPAIVLGNAARMALIGAVAELGSADTAARLYSQASTALVLAFSIAFLLLFFRLLNADWTHRIKPWTSGG